MSGMVYHRSKRKQQKRTQVHRPSLRPQTLRKTSWRVLVLLLSIWINGDRWFSSPKSEVKNKTKTLYLFHLFRGHHTESQGKLREFTSAWGSFGYFKGWLPIEFPWISSDVTTASVSLVEYPNFHLPWCYFSTCGAPWKNIRDLRFNPN